MRPSGLLWARGSSSSQQNVSERDGAVALAAAMLQQSAQPRQPPSGHGLMTVISDIQSYKEVRTRMVDLIDSGSQLQKSDFDELYINLRRTQEFARQMNVNEKGKLQLNKGYDMPLESAWNSLVMKGLVAESDDDNLIKLMIWRQHLRTQPGFRPPSFSDVRQWIGMLYHQTLENMELERKMFKNSKPRTRSELFLRLYLLAKICGVEVEFHHTDFRSG